MRSIDRADRDRVLAAVGQDRRSGYEVLARLAGSATTDPGKIELAVGDMPARQKDGSESFLYPTLHRLEADGELRSDWAPNASGKPRRVYSKRAGSRIRRIGPL